MTDVEIPDSPEGGVFPESNSMPLAESNNLVIDTNAHLTVPAGKWLDVNHNLTNYGGVNGLRLQANDTEVASLMHHSNNVEATVESYISQDKWHMISAPINNALSNLFADLYLQDFDEPTYAWTYIQPNNYDLAEGRGFMTWSASGSTGNTTIEYAGTLNNGDLTVNGLSYTASQPNDKRGWNMLGNPYPSTTQWNDNWTRINTDPVAYIYDGANYITWNATTQTGTHPNGDIAPGQGFWVKANATGASVIIPQSERKHSIQQFYKNTIENQILMTLKGNGLQDKAMIIFDDKATAGFDNQYDAWKIKGDLRAPQLYSIFGDAGMTVNTLPMQEEMNIPLGVEVGVVGIYTLIFNDFETSTELYLEDLHRAKTFKINPEFEYHFIANSGDEVHRFNLHFGNALAVEDELVSGINIYTLDSKLYIQSTDILDAELEVYNMVGQKVFSSKLFGRDYYRVSVNLSEGVYVVSLRSGKELVSGKLFVK